jgi:aspartyl-tRNA(Asn)/glutamyl-tRNA(Gln) amidotransferase subunit A
MTTAMMRHFIASDCKLIREISSRRARPTNGANANSTDYVLACRTQSLARRWFENFSKHATYCSPQPRLPPHPTVQPMPSKPRLLTRFTAPFNLTGLPALSVPCGFTRSGLPIGLQIISRHWAEARVLQAGFAYEQATEWHLKRPELA